MTDKGTKEFLAIPKEAAHHVDLETAEVDWSYGEIMDSYGVDPNFLDDLRCIGWIYLARYPESDIWDEISDALWARYRRKLAFPAGLDLSSFSDETDRQGTK
jgi:hypothetical protein